MKIAIGCDHIVTPIKNEMVKFITKLGHEVIDVGTYGETRTHYDIYGFEVGRQVSLRKADLGVVICGTGVGISNAAQKTRGVRAVLTRDVAVAVKAKELYNANVVGMGGRIIGLGLMEEIIKAFINAKYLGDNQELVKAIDQRILKDNYDIHQFDQEIKDWETGKYTEGEQQDNVPLPKTWR
jgi:galactose-6-phosphate isomerase